MEYYPRKILLIQISVSTLFSGRTANWQIKYTYVNTSQLLYICIWVVYSQDKFNQNTINKSCIYA